MLKAIKKNLRLFRLRSKEPYSVYYRILGFIPDDLSIYEQAFLHRSSSIKTEKGKWINNERLEFLGDAILDAVVADVVFHEFESKKEGFLTNTRSKIVQRETLNKLAVELGLDKLVVSATKTSSHNNYMYGNAFEAFIGAIYIDQGYNVCKKFIEERVIKQFINLNQIAHKEVNFKSKLIEWSQKNKVNVEFKLIESFTDNDNNPVFQTQVVVCGIHAGIGTGYSKKESQQNAAKATMKKINSDNEFKAALESAQNAANAAIGDNIADDKENPVTEKELKENFESVQLSDEFVDSNNNEAPIPDSQYEPAEDGIDTITVSEEPESPSGQECTANEILDFSENEDIVTSISEEELSTELLKENNLFDDSYNTEIDNSSNKAEEFISAEETAEAVIEEAMPVEEAAEAVAKPVEEAAEAVIEETMPVEETAETVIEEVKPVEETAEAIIEEAKPVEETAEAVIEETMPVEETAEAIIEEAKPVEETAEAVIEEAMPVEETTEAVIEEAKPVEEAAEAVIEETMPVEETAETVIEEVKPVEEAAEAIIEEAKPVEETVEAVIEEVVDVNVDAITDENESVDKDIKEPEVIIAEDSPKTISFEEEVEEEIISQDSGEDDNEIISPESDNNDVDFISEDDNEEKALQEDLSNDSEVENPKEETEAEDSESLEPSPNMEQDSNNKEKENEDSDTDTKEQNHEAKPSKSSPKGQKKSSKEPQIVYPSLFDEPTLFG